MRVKQENVCRGGKDEGDALTDFLVGVQDNAAGQVTHQADGEAHGQLAPLGH